MIWLFLLVGSLSVHADAPSVAPTVYHLSDLRPVGTSTYPTPSPSVRRGYLRFHNKDGGHYLVVEESDEVAPIKVIGDLRQAMSQAGVVCDLDLQCKRKAFCTGKCSNMYYQISNVGTIPGETDRCQLQSFTCEQGREPSR
jgi:hypothetical protein